MLHAKSNEPTLRVVQSRSNGRGMRRPPMPAGADGLASADQTALLLQLRDLLAVLTERVDALEGQAARIEEQLALPAMRAVAPPDGAS